MTGSRTATVTAAPPTVIFEAPLVNPSPGGLYAATTWPNDLSTESPRWLLGGVQIRRHNYGVEQAAGVWAPGWCGIPDPRDVKRGVRPELLTEPFLPVTVWGYDECDPSEASQAEVRERARQNLRLTEQVKVERLFAARLLEDAGLVPGVVPRAVGDDGLLPADRLTEDPPGSGLFVPSAAGGLVAADRLVGAVGDLVGALALTGTVGVIHASAALEPALEAARMVLRSGSSLRAPGGHQWVFGGGYIDGLGSVLVATSPTFGWRTDIAVQDALHVTENRYAAVAERSVVIAYEEFIAAVDVADGVTPKEET